MTQIVLAWELHQQGLNNTHIAKHLGRHRETVRPWLRSIQEDGLPAFLEQHQQAAKQPRPARQVRASTKRLVWAIREREGGCCGQKIAYFLKKEHPITLKEHPITLSVPKIYEVRAEVTKCGPKNTRGVPSGPRTKSAVRGQRRRLRARSYKLVQRDSIHFGKAFGARHLEQGIWSKAFDGICLHRRRHLPPDKALAARRTFCGKADILRRPSLLAADGAAFLRFTMPGRLGGFAQTIQTDGGSEFAAEFAQDTRFFCRQHRIARPYKKNEQSFIESFNRTVRRECLGWRKYQPAQLDDLTQEVEAFLECYHFHRPHLAFEPMRPPLTK